MRVWKWIGVAGVAGVLLCLLSGTWWLLLAGVAAVWAAWLHGRAGERLASSVGALGFLARELPGEVPAVLAEVAP